MKITLFNKLLNDKSLQARTLKAAAWSFLGKGFGGVLRLISNLVLSRLLYPEAFGLMATAAVFLMLVNVFSDTGVKIAIIQNPNGHRPSFINTSWSITLLRGLILFIAVFLLTPYIATFYNEPQVQKLLYLMSFSLLIESFVNPALPVLTKKLDAKKNAVFELGAQFPAFILTIILAFYLKDVMAIAIGFLATSFFRVAASYIVHPYKPKFQLEKKYTGELFRFGKFIFLNTMITWAALNSDRLLIGKFLDMEQLGYYNLALHIGTFLVYILVQVFSQSYFPALASVVKDNQRLNHIFKKTSTTILILVTPLLLIIALYSDLIIGLLYESRYAPSALALFWISLRGIPSVISGIQSATILAAGKPVYETIAMFSGFVIMIIAVPAGAVIAGLSGVSIAVLLSTFGIVFVEAFFLIKKIGIKKEIVLKPLFASVITIILFVAIFYFRTIIEINTAIFNSGFIVAILFTLYKLRIVQKLKMSFV